MQPCFQNDGWMILAQMAPWMQTVWSVVLLAIGFSLVIFVHELGHFAAAKWAGVRVERFAIGFGRELFGFTRGETRYSFNILPLGGYVKMLGQEDFVVDKSGELKVKKDPRSFTNKPVGKRMVIVTAGVIMNLLFAAIAFTVVAMIGQNHPPPIVGYVRENAPAGRAGLQPGDRILTINDETVDSFGHLSTIIALSDPGEELTMKVERNGRIVDPPPVILPEWVKDEQVRQIGVGPAQNRRVWLPSIRPSEEPDERELHQFDELYEYVINGQAKPFEDIGEVRRAIIAAQGVPIDIIVKRPKQPDALQENQILAHDPDIDSDLVPVKLSAIWLPLAYEAKDRVTASLLGLVPRMSVLQATSGKSFDQAGVKMGDIITRIGQYDYPSYAELKSVIEESVDEDVTLEVSRRRAGNHDLAAETVAFCVDHREELIAAGSAGLDKLAERITQLAATHTISKAEVEKLRKQLKNAASENRLRKWLERVDIHTLKTLKPQKPFALFSNPTPTIDAELRCIGEDHLVVADVIMKFGDRVTPAQAAGIPRGAVILAVDGQPVRKWHELSHALRDRAGKTVEIRYRLVDEVRTAKMVIPNCIQMALGLTPQDRIIKINGKSSSQIKRGDGQLHKIVLPDWLAIEALLKANVGKTVDVEYVTANGDKKTGHYTVTKDNTDPWLDRVRYYAMTFMCYPLLERHPIHNPVVALSTGIRQAYRATVQTVQSIRHMFFTRKVGFSKVSGPVGIVRAGAQIADTGLLNLLWFLGLISANLAVINFLPLPIVDGGLFLFLILEKIRGEPVSIKLQVATQLIGIALIATVFLLVTYHDIVNWITGA